MRSRSFALFLRLAIRVRILGMYTIIRTIVTTFNLTIDRCSHVKLADASCNWKLLFIFSFAHTYCRTCLTNCVQMHFKKAASRFDRQRIIRHNVFPVNDT
jgi:hypothetical protein